MKTSMSKIVIPDGWRELNDDENVEGGDMFWGKRIPAFQNASIIGVLVSTQKKERGFKMYITKRPLPVVEVAAYW
jgi:hypothetical protein